jgi:hypothetical protein
MTEIGIVVAHELGARLPSGDFSGIGGRTHYQVVLHEHDRDASRATPVGARHNTPREADRFATQIEEERNA